MLSMSIDTVDWCKGGLAQEPPCLHDAVHVQFVKDISFVLP